MKILNLALALSLALAAGSAHADGPDLPTREYPWIDSCVLNASLAADALISLNLGFKQFQTYDNVKKVSQKYLSSTSEMFTFEVLQTKYEVLINGTPEHDCDIVSIKRL